MNKFVLWPLVIVGTLSISGKTIAKDPADANPELHLIPWPKTIQLGKGHLQLTAESRIVVQEESLASLGKVLSEEIFLLTGLKLQVIQGSSQAGDIVLQIDKKIVSGEPILVLRNREPTKTTEGAHSIVIDQQVVVTGFDYRATAEGSSTILQLLGQKKNRFRLPKLTIKDWPHADYCGVMLDVARQDHSIDAIKKVVQLCRLYKARYLQLHLTDDQGWTFPSTKYPQLGSKNYGAHGGIAPRVYKLDELKDLVAYADARGVTLVPELEMPGHSGAATRAMPEIFDAINPESKQPVGIGCMNLSNETLYSTLDTIIGEMCDIFKSSPYFHIGSDEVTFGRLSLHSNYQGFMDKHGLKNDTELTDHFIRELCRIVKKHGKKAIKWEGLSNFASKDVILMCWDANSTLATEAIAKGYTTITCPWNLGVPWEEWSMYRCNGSQLKKGDSVLGATLVAWEQAPQTHLTNLRNLPSRQERTWGPDNPVTTSGFEARFQPLDAIAGKLLGLPVKPLIEVDFSTSMDICDFLDPVFALDGNDATFFQSAESPKVGDHFTVTFKQPQLIYAIEILTGVNQRGLLKGGELQVSKDGKNFSTIGKLDKGMAKVILKENQVRAIRLLASSQSSDPLVVRAINFQRMVEVSGIVQNPNLAIGSGNLAVTKGDTQFQNLMGSCSIPILNRDFTLKFNNGGVPSNVSGSITGFGKVEIYSDSNAPLTLDGNVPNTMKGIWSVISGQLVLAKQAGVDALGGTILLTGSGDYPNLVWNNSNQIQDEAEIQLLASEKSFASINLNGFSEKISRLTLATGARVLTSGSDGNGGVLRVGELWLEGKRLPQGVYTSSLSWLKGNGYIVVGNIKSIEVSGIVDNPKKQIGEGNLALLKAESTLVLPEGNGSVHVSTGNYPLTIRTNQSSRYDGLIAGNGSVRIEAPIDHQPLELSGTHSNSYRGSTTLTRGVLKLNRSNKAIAIPGDLTVGGSAPENKEDGVIWEADGQIHPSALVTLQGDQPSFLDLNNHSALLGKVVLSKSAMIRTGKRGTLRVKQLIVDGNRLKDGEYLFPQPWLKGAGKVIVDARVEIKGIVGSPDTQIGPGNIANLVGNTKISYPASGCRIDVVTNGFTLTLDSGDGNAFSCTGSISGKGNVEFFMGPSYTGFKDAPLVVGGEKPNTTSGTFFVKKGRVQLEKPRGVDAISGNVIVGGQGFNDCLFWKQSDQIKDSVNITLIDAGNNGAAYLNLNGFQEKVSGLSLTSKNKIKTDGANGISGILTVKSLMVDGKNKPNGEYEASTENWIEGKGKIVVRP